MSRLSDIPVVRLEGLSIHAFPTMTSFLHCVEESVQLPEQTVVGNVNIHAMNIAFHDPSYRDFLQDCHIIYCDGAGVMWGSQLAVQHRIPLRLTVVDFLPGMLEHLAVCGWSSYLLGWKPGIIEKGMPVVEQLIERHSVVGSHHGYIHNDKDLNDKVVQDINDSGADVLFVGMGMPLQEFWIEQNRHKLNVRTLIPIGAAMDIFAGALRRPPSWMIEADLEWLWRLGAEPKRLFKRYVVGNPWFMSRMLWTRIRSSLKKSTNNEHSS